MDTTEVPSLATYDGSEFHRKLLTMIETLNVLAEGDFGTHLKLCSGILMHVAFSWEEQESAGDPEFDGTHLADEIKEYAEMGESFARGMGDTPPPFIIAKAAGMVSCFIPILGEEPA